jgi:hypothetical protein
MKRELNVSSHVRLQYMKCEEWHIMENQFDGFINRLRNLRLVFEQKLPAKSSRFLSRIQDAVYKQLNQYDVSIEPTFKFGFVRMKAVDVSGSRMVWFNQFDNPCGKVLFQYQLYTALGRTCVYLVTRINVLLSLVSHITF